MTYIWIVVGLLLIFLLWSFLEQRMIVKSKYIINSDRIGDDIHNLSFIVLADLHNKSFGRKNKKLLNKILEQRPDFVIIAGDMITKRKPCYPGNAYNLIEKLSDHYPVYYAYGNHEQYFEDLVYNNAKEDNKRQKALYESWVIYKDKLKKLGVHVLDNTSIMLQYNNSKLIITGLSISTKFYYKGNTHKLDQDIKNKVGNSSSQGYQILIAHNPLYFINYVQWGANLTLSGHMHGGLIRIPFVGGLISPQVKLFPKYDAGQFIENNRQMVISRGLGSHSLMPRFFNPPELVEITLRNK